MKSVSSDVMPVNDMKWVGKEKKKVVCGHADKMNQPGGDDLVRGPMETTTMRSSRTRVRDCCVARPKRKESEGERDDKLSWLPFLMSA